MSLASDMIEAAGGRCKDVGLGNGDALDDRLPGSLTVKISITDLRQHHLMGNGIRERLSHRDKLR